MAFSLGTRQSDRPRHRRARPSRRRQKPKIQPPLTPMIDVTFQLLLFFLLTTTFRQAEGQIPGSLPRPPEHIRPELEMTIIKPIVLDLYMAPGGEVVFALPGSPGGVREARELYDGLVALREAYGSNEAPVLIRPEDDVPWQYAVEAFNQAVRADFRNIGFADAR